MDHYETIQARRQVWERRPLGGASVRTGTVFFFSSRRRHTRLQGDWSSDVCSSDLPPLLPPIPRLPRSEAVRGSAHRARPAIDDSSPAKGLESPASTWATVPRSAVEEIGRASCRERV